MNTNQISKMLDAFEACPLFEIFTVAEKTQLARQSHIVAYNANQEVFSFEHKGEDCFFLVASGNFKLQLKTKQSKPYHVGEIFGEIGIFNEKSRTGTIWAITAGELVAISRDTVLREGLLPSELRYKLAFTLAQQMAGYFHKGNLATSQDLISRGENENVEFKLSEKRKDEIARSLCGFMNHQGGAVFVGVDDGGKAVGLGNNTSKEDIDRLRRDIGNTLQARINSVDLHRVDIRSDKAFGKTILRIDCTPSETPVYYKEKDKENNIHEILLVRHDSRNMEIKGTSEVARFVLMRFSEHAHNGHKKL